MAEVLIKRPCRLDESFSVFSQFTFYIELLKFTMNEENENAHLCFGCIFR